MATLSKWTIFWRAFLLTLFVGAPAGSGQAGPQDDSDWQRADSAGTTDAYLWYLSRNPTGQHIKDAVNLLMKLSAAGEASGTRAVDLY